MNELFMQVAQPLLVRFASLSCVTWAPLVVPKVCSEGEEGKKCIEGSQPLCAGLNLTGQSGKTSRQAASTEALLLEEGEGDTVGCCRADRRVSVIGKALRNTGLKERPTDIRTGVGNSLKFTRAGCARWSNRLSMGPLPVAAYCAKKPKMASLYTISQGQSVRSHINTLRLGFTGSQSRQQHAVQCNKL